MLGSVEGLLGDGRDQEPAAGQRREKLRRTFRDRLAGVPRWLFSSRRSE